ncbi:MAG: arginine N-succinyltransferase [Gammaproteobacteria bacterium]|nr:arginine N-succinyltransferase [Gammaproteobacteria bacterium]
MQIIRPIKATDFDALKQIAIESGHGFTSLPVNDQLLADKIKRSQSSVGKAVLAPADEGYLFVLEDTETGAIIGTTAIEAAVGLSVPIYHYHKGKSVHHSQALDVYNTVEFLTMCNEYTGASEICTLFLRQDYRHGFAGKLLSRIRFLFMAEHPERFSDRVIAEMRGVSDDEGHSPFWEWLQEHFFSIDFPTADHLIGIGDKVFISELMPKHPIYTNLLSTQAQAVIGKVHKKTQPALNMLEKEGFEFRGYVDLFDAGPTVESRLDKINSVRDSHRCPVTIVDNEHLNSDGTVYAVCNQAIAGFKATATAALFHDKDNSRVLLSAEVASALNVVSGDQVRFINLS